LRIHALWQFYRYQLDIKSGCSIQGRGFRGKNKIRLNTDGRNRSGPYDCRYKTNIATFSEIQKFGYVGDIQCFGLAKKL
jgi:hypothetical protein